MKKRGILPFTAIGAALFLTMPVYFAVAVAGGEEHIGIIKTYTPDAAILHEGSQRKPEIGGAIYEGDTLETGSDGALGVTFIDGAVLSLGSDTKFVVDKFTFQPAEHNVSFLSRILNGTASFISGAIGRISPQDVQFKTPTATLGLRGTKILVEVE